MLGEEVMLLFVTGFMGAGKSTFARAAARHYREQSYDCDGILEARFQQTAGDQIVEDASRFRAREAGLLFELAALDRGIIALGGGAVEDQHTRALLNGKPVVFLDPGAEICWRRIQDDSQYRPLAGDYQSFFTLYIKRLPMYLSICRWRLTGDLPPEQLVRQLDSIILGSNSTG